MEIRHADLQIEVEDAEDGGVLLTIIDSARLSLSLPRRTARELLDAIDACMKTGERQTTDSVDVWRTADDLPLFGMHVGIDGASWTCGAVRSWDVDGLADELEALLLDWQAAKQAPRFFRGAFSFPKPRVSRPARAESTDDWSGRGRLPPPNASTDRTGHERNHAMQDTAEKP